MKKIVTLLITAAAFSSTFAQSNDMEEAKRIVLGERKDSRTSSPSSDPKDVVLGSDGRKVSYPRNTRYPSGTTSRSKADQINREYDAKIHSIRNNPNLSSAEKERIIRDLNNERARRLREINSDNRRYDDRNYDNKKYRNKKYDRKDDDDDDDKNFKNKKSKGNNGNHYGWQKGKGNPHKNS